ncbi:MAG: hypothetical protein RL748_47 [Pseudomonadota bacterium]|jgi:PAS domain S-box-containing protein
MNASTPGKARRVLLFFMTITVSVIVLQTAWAIAQDRNLTLKSERDNGLVAVRLLQENALQTLQDAERKLELVNHALQAIEVPHESQIQEVINQSLIDNRALKALQFTDLHGQSWISSPDYPAHRSDVSDKTHIRFLLSHPQQRDSVLGQPYQSRYDSQWVLPVARNLYNRKNQPLGILSVDIRIDYFGEVYSRTAQNNDAAVALLSHQGAVIVRSPFEARYANRDLSNLSIISRIASGAVEGSFEDDSFLDDEKKRFYTYRKLNGYPVTTVYGRDFSAILEPWQDRSRDRILFSGSSICLLSLLTFFLLQHMRRLRRTEYSLRQSENKFMGLFQRSPLPLALLNLDTRCFIEVNDLFLSEFDHSRADVLGQSPLDLRLWARPEEFETQMAQLKKQRLIDRHEVLLRHRNGQMIRCLLSARMLDGDEQNMVVFSAINITQQRQIEDEIRELNQQLEQRVKMRTNRLEQANEQLEQAFAALKEMQADLLHSEKMASLGSLVAGIAHELNTPIGNSVTIASTVMDRTSETLKSFYAQTLRRSEFQSFLEETHKGGNVLLRNLERATELVSSFKQVAVDQSSNQARKFDLRHTLEEVVMTLSPLYRKTAFTISLQLPGEIECESYPGPLGQIITNFITNAITHGFEGRDHGSMLLSAQRLDADEIQITFSDDGNGISEKNLKRVFDPFFTTKLGQGGSGLGMHIVYNLVTGVLGGKIELESQPGQGTKITLTLPRIAPNLQKTAQLSA